MAAHPFEILESRRLLSVTLDQGELAILGTKKNDNISLTIEATTPDQVSVNVNGFVRRFLLSDVETINIQAGQGNDYVFLDPGKAKLNQPTRLYGSGGDDTLIGGAGRDRIYGGSQNDRAESNNGADIIYGEAGADTLNGGRGSDVIDGGDDNDVIIGGLGVDRLYGDVGDDTFSSKDGAADAVNGGPDTDSADTDVIDGLTSIEDILNPR